MTLARRFLAVKSDKAIELKDIKCLKQESLKCNLLIKKFGQGGSLPEKGICSGNVSLESLKSFSS